MYFSCFLQHTQQLKCQSPQLDIFLRIVNQHPTRVNQCVTEVKPEAEQQRDLANQEASVSCKKSDCRYQIVCPERRYLLIDRRLPKRLTEQVP